MDIAKRCEQNPLLAPKDLKAGINGMEITCLLNPGVFKYQGKIWLLLRVAERPIQKEGIISFPIYNEKGKIEVVSFLKNDPDLDASDPRVIGYKGKNYLTTMSYLRLVSVPTVFTSKMNRNFHLFSEKESWKHSVLKIAVLQQPKMVFTLLSQKYRR